MKKRIENIWEGRKKKRGFVPSVLCSVAIMMSYGLVGCNM